MSRIDRRPGAGVPTVSGQGDQRAGARRTAIAVGLLAFGLYAAFLIKAAVFGL